MIWFGIAAVVAVIGAIREGVQYRDVMGSIMSFLVYAFIGGTCAFFLSLVVGLSIYEKDYDHTSFDVVAAKDGSSIQGSFSIFSGFVDEEPYYFYYRQYSDGRIEQGKIPAGDTAIYEDQETHSYIEETKCDSHLWFWGLIDGCDPTYEIHVPAGSVRQDVEFDLE